MKTKITIKDIAREAGVSIATVSYVLNNKTEERISEETRKKVLQIINL
jgi:DNA-binding LacI/PurR family transcriptional regulator